MQQNLTLLTPVSAFALKYFIKDALRNSNVSLFGSVF